MAAKISRAGAPQSGTVSDFLQPHSMMTPGLLGALVMLGTNAFIGAFPSLNGAIVGLALSFLFGFAAVIKKGPPLQRVLFYLLNSIIIFSVAAGTNTVGRTTQHAYLSINSTAFAADRGSPHEENQRAQFFKSWFEPRTPSVVQQKRDTSTAHIIPPASEITQSDWNVIATSYPKKEDAEKRAKEINQQFPGKYHATVREPLKSSPNYVLILGSKMSLEDAVKLKIAADKDKIAPDTFIWSGSSYN